MLSRRTVLSFLSGVVVLAAVGTYFLVRSPEPRGQLLGPGGNNVAIPNTVPGKSYPTDAGGLCVKGGGTATILSVRPATNTDVRVTGFSFTRYDPGVRGDARDYGGRRVSIPCTTSDSLVHIMVDVARTGREPEGRANGYEVRYRLAGNVHVVDMGSSALLCPGKLKENAAPATCLS